jgi:S-sulfo-L-cysteine synthase (O-acetyl-L-serine-dependent)
MSTLYKEAVLEHFRKPRNFGELANADVCVRERNPLCGDHIALYLAFDGERRLTDVRFSGRGCVMTTAGASTLTERMRGKSLQELQQIDRAPLLELLDAEPPAVRMKCVNLSLEALRRGLAMYERDAAKASKDAGPAAAHRHGLLDHIGDTPLVRLKPAAWGLPPRVQLFAKLESRNPGGTVKARSVHWAIQEALSAAHAPLLPGMELLDVASGSSASIGVALALIGAQLGFATKLIVPAAVPDTTKRVLRAYGARLHVLVDPSLDARAAADIARETRRKSPGRIYFLDAFHSPAAANAHYATTGAEILAQAGQPITHFVAGVGSGATLSGVARRLKEHLPAVQVLGVVPASAADRIEGLNAAGASAGSPHLDAAVQDGTIEVTAKESCERARQLARHEGLLVGTSSGAALAASLRLASQLTEGTIVTLFPDDGQRYLDEPYWLDDY